MLLAGFCRVSAPARRLVIDWRHSMMFVVPLAVMMVSPSCSSCVHHTLCSRALASTPLWHRYARSEEDVRVRWSSYTHTHTLCSCAFIGRCWSPASILSNLARPWRLSPAQNGTSPPPCKSGSRRVWRIRRLGRRGKGHLPSKPLLLLSY